MTLKEFLTKHGRVGEVIIFRENGWQIGLTRIDNDDLYLRSLSTRMLNRYEVMHFDYEERDWINKRAFVIDVLPTMEATRHVRKRMVSR